MGKEMEMRLVEKSSDDLWRQYRQAAWTTVLVREIQEALEQDRAPDEEVVRYTLQKGADARALGQTENEPSDFEDEDDDEDDEDSYDEDEEDEDDDDDDDDYSGGSDDS